MGFFTKTDGAPTVTTALPPLSKAAIRGVLDQRGYSYGEDGDGDLGGRWGDHVFFFFLYGENQEIFQVRGRWNRPLPQAHLGEVMTLLNTWNADKIWPKAYVRVEDDGLLGIYAETSVDFEHGVTPDQLAQVLLCGLQTGMRLFETLDEEFPAAVEAFAAANADRA